MAEKIIASFDFVDTTSLENLGLTPSYGNAFYDSDTDRSIVVYSDKQRIFFDRSDGVDMEFKLPWCFKYYVEVPFPKQ
jgi:hypothetical protein